LFVVVLCWYVCAMKVYRAWIPYDWKFCCVSINYMYRFSWYWKTNFKLPN